MGTAQNFSEADLDDLQGRALRRLVWLLASRGVCAAGVILFVIYTLFVLPRGIF